MGATGSEKSKFSIDLATHFFPYKIINSNKIQVSKILNIINNNKISMPGVVHHLLGEFSPSESHPEFSPFNFRSEVEREKLKYLWLGTGKPAK